MSLHPNTTFSPNTLLLNTLAVVPLATYTLLVTTVGLLGNSLVIYSSIRYNAIQLDKVSVLFVQNLAVADLVYILCNVLPSAVTYIAGRYVLGSAYCFINAAITLIPGSVNTLTILALTAYRLLIVVSPYRAFTLLRARVIVGLTWLVACVPVAVVLAYESKSVFVRTYAACVSDVYERKEATAVVRLCLGSIIILPILGTTVINAILCTISISLKKKARARRKMNEGIQNELCPPNAGINHQELKSGSITQLKPKKKNNPLITVCILSGCFVASWTPYVIYVLWKTRDPGVPPLLELFAFHAIQLNAVCNPILYTMTNRRFGRYVKQLLRRFVPRCLLAKSCPNSHWAPSWTANSATFNVSPNPC